MTKDRELVAQYAPDFELPGIDKQVYRLGRYLQQYKTIAVLFISNQCPVVNQYLNRIRDLQTEFNSQGFSFMAINSQDFTNNPQESIESMQLFAEKHQLSFPYLKDPTQDVARSFGIEVTPEVFLLDKRSVIRYAGTIDDNAESPNLVTKTYLRDNIINLLAAPEISITYTEPIGTPIQWLDK